MSNTTQNLSLFKWDATNATDKASRFNIPVSLNENWDNIDAFAGQIREVIGTATDTFSTSETYEVGDIVIHNKALYKCTTAVTTAGEFNSNNWTEISIKDLIDEIKQELEGKVDKVTGKGLSTEDYTTAEKTKLDGIESGAEVNVIETVKVNGTALVPSNKEVDVPVPTKTSDLTNDSGFIDKDVNNLTNYYDKNAVDTKIASVYKYKGTVSTYNDLPSTNLTVGDVYNIETADSTHGIKAGDNVAWTGTTWDVLAGTVDLSGYQTKIDSSHKLESDLVDDTNSTHKFVTSEEKTQISTNATDIDNIKDGTEIDSFGDVETENALLKDQIPNGTAEGTNVQITDSSNLLIEDGVIKGYTSQETREGYQLINTSLTKLKELNTAGTWNNNVYSRSGMTFTINTLEDDTIESIVVNGTSSSAISDFQLEQNVTLEAGNYTISGCPSGGSISTYYISIALIGSTIYLIDIGSTQSTAIADTASNLTTRIFIANGVTLNNAVFKPMVTSGSTVKPYEPYTGGQASPSPAYPQTIHTVTGNCNTNFSDENGEAEQNAPLTLGNIELCKIGNYQDYLFKNTRTLRSGRANPLFNPDLDEGDWYKYSAIGKVVLDGSESGWHTSSLSVTGYKSYFVNTGIQIKQYTAGSKCNYFKYKTYDDWVRLLQATFIESTDKTIGIRVVETFAPTLEDFKTWLSTHNTIVYYVLATPTYTKITDTALIPQLEAYYNSSTYRNVTNIITAGEDLAPIASIVYKKDLTTLFNRLDSLEARVDLLEE